jgi:hypothetical protein
MLLSDLGSAPLGIFFRTDTTVSEGTDRLGQNHNLCHVMIRHQNALPRHFLIPWTGGAFAPLGPFLCPTTEEKKWPIAPKSGH